MPEVEVGVYFGTAPSFSSSSNAERREGFFAGRRVEWQRSPIDAKRHQWETLLPYRHDPHSIELQVHIWLVAPDEKAVDDLFDALREVRISQRTTKAAA